MSANQLIVIGFVYLSVTTIRGDGREGARTGYDDGFPVPF